MQPKDLLAMEYGEDVIKIGGLTLPAEDFSMSNFMRNELGMSWLHPGGINSTEQLLSLFALMPGMRVLDLGCGLGTTARKLVKEHGCVLDAVDNDQTMLRVAAKQTPKWMHNVLNFTCMDAAQLQFEDNTFDLVLIQSVLCFNDKAAVLKEVNRVLKPDGRLALNESTWVQPPSEQTRRVTRSTICETFSAALDEYGWMQLISDAGLENELHKVESFTDISPYQMLREEGAFNTLRVMWRVFRNPRINTRLNAVSRYFKTFPGYFGYGLFVARKVLL